MSGYCETSFVERDDQTRFSTPLAEMAPATSPKPAGITIIVAPFHAGAYMERVGKGPHEVLDTLVDQLVLNLRKLDPDGRSIYDRGVNVVEIDRVDIFEGEIGRTFEVKRRIAAEVRDAVNSGRFPLVLAGNCNSTVGVYSGLPEVATDVVWFDAHPDFNTPDEVTSGYFDGMGVATLAGHAWKKMAYSIPGFQPLSLNRLIYCGIRDFEVGQQEKVEDLRIRAVYGGEGHVDYAGGLERLLRDDYVGFPALVHLDLDVLDSDRVGHVNEYAAPGGMAADDLFACLKMVVEHRRPVAMMIASFNPDCDTKRKKVIADIARRAAVMVALAGLAMRFEHDS